MTRALTLAERFAQQGDEELPPVHPLIRASDQVMEAGWHLDKHPDLMVRWPFEALDELTGPMREGEVWFVAAYSGGGKTSFVGSAIDAWRQAGKKVYVMPLEIQAFRFRIYLACMALGIHPGDALSGKLRLLPDGEAKRAAIKAELDTQTNKPYVDQVMVSEQRAINVMGLQEGLKEAKSFGADIVIVDHIDHIEGGDGSNGFRDSKAVNQAALRMAQDNEMLLVFTSQLNMEIGKGKDYLAKYQPPMPHHLMFPSVKLHVCTGMIGLYRPLRAPMTNETEKEYAAAMKLCRTGTADAQDALERNTMGVVAMKLRNYGQNEGRRVALAFNRGRVENMNERDKYVTGVLTRGPRP